MRARGSSGQRSRSGSSAATASACRPRATAAAPASRQSTGSEGVFPQAAEWPANAALAQDDVGDWGLDDPANPETDVQQVCEQALEHVVELISEIIALPSLKSETFHAHA